MHPAPGRHPRESPPRKGKAPPRTARADGARPPSSEHVTDTEIEPALRFVGCVPLHIGLEHDLRVDPEIDAYGLHPLVVLGVLGKTESRVLLLPYVIALEANERRDIEVAFLVYVVCSLYVSALHCFRHRKRRGSRRGADRGVQLVGAAKRARRVERLQV